MKRSVRLIPCATVALALVLCPDWAAGQIPAEAAGETPAEASGPTPAEAAGQIPAEGDPQEPQMKFLPRSVFHMSAEYLSGDDVMFVWDTNFGGEIDVVDYQTGRATFVANYQAILGDEFRHFDPNQGNYILSGSASLRTRDVEVAGVFYHQSRHLADRPNRVAVAWNMMGVRLRRAAAIGRTRLDAYSDVRGVVAKSFVDYRWEIDSGVRSDVPIRPGVRALFGGGLRLLGVDGTQDRGNQAGFRGEVGLGFEGGKGAMEFFLAVERRVDPYPLEFGTARWATVGFRLLSR